MSISDQNSNVLNVPDWKSFWRGQTRCLNKQIDKINSSPIDLNRIHDDYVECQKDFSIYVKSIANVCKELGYFDDLPNPFNVSQREEYLKTSVEWDLLQLVQVMFANLIMLQEFFLLERRLLDVFIVAIIIIVVLWCRRCLINTKFIRRYTKWIIS